MGLQRDPPVSAAKNLRGPDRLAFGKDGALLEIPKTPFERFLCLVRTLLGSAHPCDDHDQPEVVLNRRPDQAVTRLFCVAGLKTVGTVHGAEKWIAILLANLVPGEFRLRKKLVEIRIGPDDVSRKRGKLTGGHLLIRIR